MKTNKPLKSFNEFEKEFKKLTGNHSYPSQVLKEKSINKIKTAFEQQNLELKKTSIDKPYLTLHSFDQQIREWIYSTIVN